MEEEWEEEMGKEERDCNDFVHFTLFYPSVHALPTTLANPDPVGPMPSTPATHPNVSDITTSDPRVCNKTCT